MLIWSWSTTSTRSVPVGWLEIRVNADCHINAKLSGNLLWFFNLIGRSVPIIIIIIITTALWIKLVSPTSSPRNWVLAQQWHLLLCVLVFASCCSSFWIISISLYTIYIYQKLYLVIKFCLFLSSGYYFIVINHYSTFLLKHLEHLWILFTMLQCGCLVQVTHWKIMLF